VCFSRWSGNWHGDSASPPGARGDYGETVVKHDIFLPCYYYLALSFYSCTCRVPTISVLNLAISPCCTNLLLRRWRWTEILWWGVLVLALSRLLFLWCLEPSIIQLCKRVFLLLRYNIYVINVLFCDIWLFVNTYVHVCGINHLGHTYD
jgi:hypothetical protein